MDDTLVVEYEASLADAYKHLATSHTAEEKKKWRRCISNLENAIHYMKHGVFCKKDVWGDKWNEENKHVYVEDAFFAQIPEPIVTDEVTVSELDRQILDEMLAALSPKEYECFYLKYTQDFSMAQIADMLDMNKETLKTNLRRAKAKINKAKAKSLLVMVRGWDN